MDRERFRQVECLFWEMIDSDDQRLEAFAKVAGDEDQATLRRMAVSLIRKDRELDGSSFLKPPEEPGRKTPEMLKGSPTESRSPLSTGN
ncbi:MAG: hypothetical protein AAFX06_16190 [Planctomycetota bacterium]